MDRNGKLGKNKDIPQYEDRGLFPEEIHVEAR